MPVGKPNSCLSDTEMLDFGNYYRAERLSPLLRRKVARWRKWFPIITKCDLFAVKPNTSRVSPNGATRITSKDRGLFFTFELYLHNRKAFACWPRLQFPLYKALLEVSKNEWYAVRVSFSENTHRLTVVYAESESGAKTHFNRREFDKLVVYLKKKADGKPIEEWPKYVERKSTSHRCVGSCEVPKMSAFSNELLGYLNKYGLAAKRFFPSLSRAAKVNGKA